MKYFLLLYIIFSFYIFNGHAQSFPPAAGFEGSTAVRYDSSIIVNWAVGAHIVRGYKDIAYPADGLVNYGADSCAIGPADGNNGVISLGDGGSAVLSFKYPITDGPGFDFAVFENGFFQNDTSELAFLELAFVEVSTDGIEYIRFPSISMIQTEFQTEPYEKLNASEINNLAGKYTAFYGTPFDLHDIRDLSFGTGVNPDTINYVKIIDVIGCIENPWASFDSEMNVINDPYPTPFSSGGFDLDAVAVINQTVHTNQSESDLLILQNPVSDRLKFVSTLVPFEKIEIISVSGKLSMVFNSQSEIDIGTLRPGIYLLKISGNSKTVTKPFMKL
jgi:hypothetical protein